MQTVNSMTSARAEAIRTKATEHLQLCRQLPRDDTTARFSKISSGNAMLMEQINEWLERLPEDERRAFEGMLQQELLPIFAGYFQAISERVLALRNAAGK